MSESFVYVARPCRHDRRVALAVLRDIASDRSGMLELRALLAGELRRSCIHRVRDDTVLELLADRVASGSLTLAWLRRPEPEMPLHGEESDAAVPEEATAPPPAEEKKKTKMLTDPRWSVPRVQVGTELDAIFTYSGFDPGQSVIVKVFECNQDGSRTELKPPVTTSVEGESGDHKVKWKRDPESAQADLAQDLEENDSGPVEYRFHVEADGTGDSGESGPLWLTNTVTVKLVNEDDGEKHGKPVVVVLKDALNKELRSKAKDGDATFERVLVGPIQVRLAALRFEGLGWSKPKVPVGEKVDAVFTYDDAMPGQKVSLAIHETNADGTMSEVARIDDIELSKANGEVHVPWSRSEGEAQADMEADEREGDSGPVEYHFFLTAEDGTTSELSAPLHLTHTVVVKLEHAVDNAPFPDGIELVLVGADGTEHPGTLSAGEVTFQHVVCGPMTIKLAPSGAGEQAP